MLDRQSNGTNGGAPAPRVTVGLPVLNGERYLADTLDTWLAQDFRAFELVVSDNASTDATPDILADYAARDGRIRVIRRDSTVELADNFNGLVREAAAPYFAWAACDDPRHPAFLGRTVRVLDEHPDVVLAFCRVQRLTGDAAADVGRVYFAPIAPGTEERALDRTISILRHAKNHAMIFGLTRVEVLRRTHLFRHHLGIASDVGLVLELAAHGRFHCVPEVLMSYRVHEHATHQTRDDPMYQDGRGKAVDDSTVEHVRAMPLSRVEQDLLLREIAIWCQKGRHPRPLLLRSRKVRSAYVHARRGMVDLKRWFHGV